MGRIGESGYSYFFEYFFDGLHFLTIVIKCIHYKNLNGFSKNSQNQ